MARLFEITAEILQIAQDGFDDLLDQLGKQCQLIYPPEVFGCTNCIFDTINNRSSNRYNSVGPEPFTDGEICPVCNGTGHLESTATDNITLLLNWEPSVYKRYGGNLVEPYSVLETKGYMTEVGKVKRARKMLVQLPIEPYIRAFFELNGEPIDRNNIVKNRYFVALWKRVNG